MHYLLSILFMPRFPQFFSDSSSSSSEFVSFSSLDLREYVCLSVFVFWSDISWRNSLPKRRLTNLFLKYSVQTNTIHRIDYNKYEILEEKSANFGDRRKRTGECMSEAVFAHLIDVRSLSDEITAIKSKRKISHSQMVASVVNAFLLTLLALVLFNRFRSRLAIFDSSWCFWICVDNARRNTHRQWSND